MCRWQSTNENWLACPTYLQCCLQCISFSSAYLDVSKTVSACCSYKVYSSWQRQALKQKIEIAEYLRTLFHLFYSSVYKCRGEFRLNVNCCRPLYPYLLTLVDFTCFKLKFTFLGIAHLHLQVYEKHQLKTIFCI